MGSNRGTIFNYVSSKFVLEHPITVMAVLKCVWNKAVNSLYRISSIYQRCKMAPLMARSSSLVYDDVTCLFVAVPSRSNLIAVALNKILGTYHFHLSQTILIIKARNF